jgi:thiosulfate/3-mercaptopyruvate sulfurtransferase
MQNIVSTNWVHKNLKNKKLIIFDCSWHLPKDKRNSYKEFRTIHIKNSLFFNIDKISDKKSKFPHMIPPSKYFQNIMRSYGVNKNSKIVVYDTIGIFSSARVWWLFKYYDHKNVFVMNGGLKKWLNEKKPTTKKVSKIKKKGDFVAKENKFLKTDYKNILKNLYNNKFLILDARNNLRFNGKIKEPRSGIRSGHIPNSKNLFWGNLINENGTIKTKTNLLKILKPFNLTNKNKIITSCGSGVTACILSLAILHSKSIFTQVYDGSWSEWGMKKKLPIEI